MAADIRATQAQTRTDTATGGDELMSLKRRRQQIASKLGSLRGDLANTDGLDYLQDLRGKLHRLGIKGRREATVLAGVQTILESRQALTTLRIEQLNQQEQEEHRAD